MSDNNKSNSIIAVALKRMVLSVFSLLAILLALEMSARLYMGDRFEGEVVSEAVVPHPCLMWVLKSVTNGPYMTNELGFRDNRYNPNADFKVLLLGDSVSWGHGVNDLSAVYPVLAEDSMNRNNTNRVIEIINASVPGYSTFQEAEYLRRYGFALKPDMIILQFCLNDVVERYSVLANEGGVNYFMGVDTRLFIAGRLGKLTLNSKLMEFIWRLRVRKARDWQEYQVANLAADRLSPQIDVAWTKVLGEIDDIRSLAVSNNVPLVLLICPYAFQLKDPAKLCQPQQRLVNYATSRKLKYVDLLPVFSGNRNVSDVEGLFIDENHFSRKGHVLAARELVAIVTGVGD